MQNSTQQEALQHALQSLSMANYAAIFSGFEAKGIALDDIKPRENVFTFNAWQALGRQVRKGEHGVSICTWIPMSKKDADGVAQPIGRKPRTTTVFHVSQTEPRDGYSETLWQYALKHGAQAENASDEADNNRACEAMKAHAERSNHG